MTQYQRYREAGRCGNCGQPPVEGKSRCQNCMDKQNNKNKEIRIKGLCSQCREPAVKNKSLCSDCLNKQNEKRTKNKVLGRCRYCGKTPVKGKSACQKCLNSHHKSNKKRSTKRLSLNVCRDCGKPTRENKTCCQKCLDKSNKNRRVKRLKRLESKICVRCGKHQSVEGKTACFICAIIDSLRANLYNWFKLNGKQKSSKTEQLLGCSYQEFITYLIPKFQRGMTLENHGEWHIDHIIPLASFDITDPEQQRQACHYTNLQPLWAKDNLSKGAKIL